MSSGIRKKWPVVGALRDLRVQRDRARHVVVDELLELLHVVDDVGRCDVLERELARRRCSPAAIEYSDTSTLRPLVDVFGIGEREQRLRPHSARCAVGMASPAVGVGASARMSA